MYRQDDGGAIDAISAFCSDRKVIQSCPCIRILGKKRSSLRYDCGHVSSRRLSDETTLAAEITDRPTSQEVGRKEQCHHECERHGNKCWTVLQVRDRRPTVVLCLDDNACGVNRDSTSRNIISIT